MDCNPDLLEPRLEEAKAPKILGAKKRQVVLGIWPDHSPQNWKIAVDILELSSGSYSFMCAFL